MKILLSLTLVISCYVVGYTQKKPLDYLGLKQWPVIANKKISNDGKYVTYTISSDDGESSLFVQATDNSWKKEIILNSRASFVSFSEDNLFFIFSKSADSLGILELGRDNLRYLDRIASFKMPLNGGGSWLAYKLVVDSTNSLYLYNISTGLHQSYTLISDFAFCDYAPVIVMKKYPGVNDNFRDDTIIWADLAEGQKKIISHANNGSGFLFDQQGLQLIFYADNNINSRKEKCIMYYKTGMDSAIVLVNSTTAGMEGMQFDPEGGYIYFNDGGVINPFTIPRFSRNGKKLFFSIRSFSSSNLAAAEDTLADVNVWNYKDEFLKPMQSTMASSARNFTAVINLDQSNKLVRLEKNEDNIPVEISQGENDEYALIDSDKKGDTREYWRINSRPNVHILSTKDSSRKLIGKRLMYDSWQFSPSGKYLIWYDGVKSNWSYYNIESKVIKDIKNQVPVPLYRLEDFKPCFDVADGFAGWLEKNKGVLLYDQYDIWCFDLEGTKIPVNITHGFGRKNKIVLRLIDVKHNTSSAIHYGDTLLLTAFNEVTKERGFYGFLTASGELRKLFMGPYSWYLHSARGNEFVGVRWRNNFLFKAKNANTFLLYRMSATDYPNLYVTHNFSEFTPLTNLAPQSRYNWYTSELVHWKMPEGRKGEGILYKPENFDPKKKYPIIFYFYEKSADALNQFIKPELSNGIMNIPWFVSNGYLVCVPDISYRKGYTGRSAYDAVVSAALYLSKKPWVDSKKMGLQGHSHGGFEVNYIVTKSHLFAAAVAASGTTEQISQYGSVSSTGSTQFYYEDGQGRIGATLWEKPELYIENSPIFKADKVTTPLLLMANKGDITVISSTQAVPWFVALRRLGKKVWMLDYDNEDHTISLPKNQLDFSIRMNQFFDHYLKGNAPPKWMTIGVPLYKKKIESGLELDYSGKEP